MDLPRRELLAGIGSASVIGTAGCLGGGGSDTGSNTDVGTPSGPSLSTALSQCTDTTVEPVSSLPSPTMGQSEAAVSIEVFEDFACSHCQTFSTEVFPQIREQFISEGVVSFQFRDFPIPVDPWSWYAASAARSTQDIGGEASFFKFTKKIYEQQSVLLDNGYQLIHDAAEAAGISGCTAAVAAETLAYQDVVRDDKQSGIELEVPGTPAVFVNVTLLQDYRWETVKQAVETER